MQTICDGLGPAQIDGLLRKWLARLPHPFDTQDRAAGYRYDLSILQAQFSLTQMLDNPTSGPVFFEHLSRDNLDIGRPPTSRGHSEPARGLQTRHDQAVPQGRQGATDRDDDQQHPRFRDRETTNQSARAAGDRLLRQPGSTARATTRSPTNAATPFTDDIRPAPPEVAGSDRQDRGQPPLSGHRLRTRHRLPPPTKHQPTQSESDRPRTRSIQPKLDSIIRLRRI